MTTGSVTTIEAGRIRDAARITWFSGILALVTLFASLFVASAVVGFIAAPIALGLLVLACFPLFRHVGTETAALVTAVGLIGVVLEIAGFFITQPDSQFRIGTIFGAGTVALGGWFIGAGGIVGRVGGFSAGMPAKCFRAGAGLAILGVSWFVEDLVLSLAMLVIGAGLTAELGLFVKEARRFGLSEPAATDGGLPT